jgi:hypothetical protein
MSLDIVKKNSSSPFQLQRSMVDQGGAGGAYESGGYNPEAVYNNDAANAAVESLGKVVGAAIYAKSQEKKEEKPKFDTAGAEKARSEYEKIEKDKKEKEDASKSAQLNKQLGGLWKR